MMPPWAVALYFMGCAIVIFAIAVCAALQL